MLHLSTRLRVTLAALVVFAGFHLVYSYYWVRHNSEIWEQSFDTQIASAVEFTGVPLSAAVWEFDKDGAKQAVSGLAKLPDYQFSYILSAGEIFLRHSASGKWAKGWERFLAHKQSSGDGDYGNLKIITVPLMTKSESKVGELTLGFSRDRIIAEQQATIQEMIYYGGAYSFAIAIVLYFLLSRIMRPLSDVAKAVRQFSKGKMNGPSPHSKRADEIGALAKAVDLLQESFVEARTDELTGLPNRRAFDDRLSKFEGRDNYALAIIDLDDFKPINDNFGHRAGDRVLTEMATRLESRVGRLGEILRIGGDEFVIIWSHLTNREEAKEIGQEIADDICEAVRYEDNDLFVGVSVGIALSNEVRGRPLDVLSAADSAMYVAKETATTRVHVFDPSKARRQFSISDARELETALSQRQIEPWFQPQICLETGKLCGFEALARWEHPQLGQQMPSNFLPKVDALQMQRQFDVSMLGNVLTIVRDWLPHASDHLNISINLAEETLARPEGVSDLFWLLEEYEDCRQHITLEITEDVFTARSADAIKVSLERMFERGMRVSMDDFGTGYGSFRHLQEYNFDEMKIDRRFIHKIGQDHSSEVIIQGFISVAHGLGARVVGEGIETKEQAAFLASLGCNTGQGFLFGHAVDADTAKAHLRKNAINPEIGWVRPKPDTGFAETG